MSRSAKVMANSRAAERQPGEFQALLGVYPVIPAIRSVAHSSAAAAAPSRVVYVLAAALSRMLRQSSESRP